MQTLFISYCWEDGTLYADDLENELSDKFDVRRDKSSLRCNDNIDSFMHKIADCDNVVIVLTQKYLKSKNCMKEVAYLSKQPEWNSKCVVLVIYNDIYSLDTQEEILSYWEQKRNTLENELKNSRSAFLCREEYESVLDVCNTLEAFLLEVKHRNNPSQIRIVNEIVRLSERSRGEETELLSKVSNKVQTFIESKGKTTLSEIEKETGYPKEVVDRFVGVLKDNSKVFVDDMDNYYPQTEREVIDDFLELVNKNSVSELTPAQYDELELRIGDYLSQNKN